MMRNNFWLAVALVFLSCQGNDEETFTGRQIKYKLLSANSEYPYEGTALFREMETGSVEITIQLSGDRGDVAYYFPAHLHYGVYGMPDAPMAAMLNPLDLRTLKSETIIDKLSSGEAFRFDDLEDFDGHIKVHLADDGPDYHVILVAGNIGKNNAADAMAMEKIALWMPF
jgi:hypothetical protein